MSRVPLLVAATTPGDGPVATVEVLLSWDNTIVHDVTIWMCDGCWIDGFCIHKTIAFTRQL